MAAHRPQAAWAKPAPIGYAASPEPSRVFVEELRAVDPASITAGWSMPPVFQDYQMAVDAARGLAFQWSAWASVVAGVATRTFLVLTGAHEEFLETHLVLVQVGPEGQERYPWATE